MPLTLRTLPRDERQGIDLPEHFRWGLWPAFLPVWVLDVYYGVCTSSLLELSGMEQLTAIHHSVYPYSYSDAFHKRALTRLSRWLEYEIPMDVLGSLNMLADLRLVSVSEGSYDGFLSPPYPEQVLRIPFWHRKQLATYRYHAVYKDILSRLGQLSTRGYVQVDVTDLREILGVSQGTLRSILNIAANRRLISVRKRKSPRGRTLLRISFHGEIAIPTSEAERSFLQILKEKGDVIETTLAQLSACLGIEIEECRSLLHSLNVKEKLFLDDPIQSAGVNDGIFIDLTVTSFE